MVWGETFGHRRQTHRWRAGRLQYANEPDQCPILKLASLWRDVHPDEIIDQGLADIADARTRAVVFS